MHSHANKNWDGKNSMTESSFNGDKYLGASRVGSPFSDAFTLGKMWGEGNDGQRI